MCPCPDKKRQRGASLIEFAFVLPLLLVILIGTIYFGYVYMLQSAVIHAAQQATTAAVGVSPAGLSGSEYQSAVSDVVVNTVSQSLDWLPDSINDGITTTDCFSSDDDEPVVCTLGGTEGSLLTVIVAVNVAGGSSPLLPQINLPPFGRVPPAGLTQVTGVAEVTL